MFSLKSAKRLSRAVRVEWEDGLSAQFTYVWLRDNGDRRPSLAHLDLNARPQNIDLNRKTLNVMWPPFLSSEYSSKFLRQHTTVKHVQAASCSDTKRIMTKPWFIVDRNSAEDFTNMAVVEWGEHGIEHGTVWPHLSKVPSLVTVESYTEDSKLNMVDGVTALDIMSRTHPEQFRFLTSTPIEYQRDLFKSSHNIAEIHDGEVIRTTFNNVERTAEITTENLDAFYESLKILNDICCTLMSTITLQPGQLLLVDNHRTYIGAPAQCGRRLRFKMYD